MDISWALGCRHISEYYEDDLAPQENLYSYLGDIEYTKQHVPLIKLTPENVRGDVSVRVTFLNGVQMILSLSDGHTPRDIQSSSDHFSSQRFELGSLTVGAYGVLNYISGQRAYMRGGFRRRRHPLGYEYE